MKKFPRVVQMSAKKLEGLMRQWYDLGRRDGVAEQVARTHNLPLPVVPKPRAPMGKPLFPQ